MSKVLVNRVGLWSLPLLMAAFLAAGSVSGQEKGKESGPENSPAKAEKRITRRLPPYYGEVVTQEQREKIYAIQAKIAEQVFRLREQLETLESQQKTEIEGVLTAEQRQQVIKLAEDAKAKRSRKSTNDQPVGATN